MDFNEISYTAHTILTLLTVIPIMMHASYRVPAECNVIMTSKFVWNELDQRIIDKENKQWCTHLRACVEAKGGHFEHKR